MVFVVLAGAYVFTDRPHTEPGVIGTIERTQADDRPREEGTTPPTSPREQASREEWSALLPRLEEEVRRRPDDDVARRRLALALYNLDRLDEAQALYEQILSESEDAVVRNRLGNVLREKGELPAAEAAYRLSLATDPTLPAPYVNLSELLQRLGRRDEALGLLSRGADAVAPEARPVLERAAAAIRADSEADGGG